MMQTQARAEMLLRQRMRNSFRAFIKQAFPAYEFHTYAERLIAALEDVEAGKVRRLMVFMPPRHGKSELVSRLFPAWCLLKNPGQWVGLNSYGAELAYKFSRRAREYYRDAGGAINAERSAVKEWETTGGGGLWAAGVGGPITGKGFDVGIIDDPIKNAEEAASPTIRAKHKEWYKSTFYTREEPGGAIIVVQTRWHPDDLSGWLLDRESSSGQPEQWHVISMDAVHEDRPDVPSTCTLEEDWREQGEALAPERYPKQKLQSIKANVGSKVWASLYQQQPVDSEGALWSWGDIVQGPTPDAYTRVVVGVDPAGGGGNEHGVLVCGMTHNQTAHVIEDCTQPGSASPATWAKAAINAYKRNESDRIVAERNFGGDMVESTIRSVDEDVPVTIVNASRGKKVRAEPVAALYEQGRVTHAPGLDKLEGQMTTWDPDADDGSPDRVDALVWALTELFDLNSESSFFVY